MAVLPFVACISLIILPACLDNPFLDRVRTPAQETVSTSVPDVALETLSGDSVGLHEVLAGEPTLLAFWATWCHPCEREMRELVRLHERWNGSGVRIVGIAVASDSAEIQEWIARHEIAFPLFTGLGTGEMIDELDHNGVPYALLVDTLGMARFRWVGAREAEEMERYLLDVLVRPAGSPTDSDARGRRGTS